MGKLFGTDGARGIANKELTCEVAMQIGRAAATVLTRHVKNTPKIIIAQDTRISGHMLESALVAGICSVGVDVELLGVLPTPAVSWLIGEYGADAGVMISASHNPVEFNGIKLFSGTGYKLSDEMEEEIEDLIFNNPQDIKVAQADEIGRVTYKNSAHIDYINHIKATIKGDLTGLNIALDCANGSASVTAHALFTNLGATVHTIHCEPNGININDKCGSTHTESISEFVRENGYDLGFAFDGDADRCFAIDENGEVVDGDQIMAILATEFKRKGKLVGDTLVATVMTNYGMHSFAKENDINLVCTAVGDRYVLEEMLKSGYNLGGEQSGHIIFKDYVQTGDGQLTAVQIASIYKKYGKKMSELADTMVKMPQILIGVKVSAEQKSLIDTDDEIIAVINDVQTRFGDEARVLVRASGTEPLIRIMMEGKDEDEIKAACNEIAEAIKAKL